MECILASRPGSWWHYALAKWGPMNLCDECVFVCERAEYRTYLLPYIPTSYLKCSSQPIWHGAQDRLAFWKKARRKSYLIELNNINPNVLHVCVDIGYKHDLLRVVLRCDLDPQATARFRHGLFPSLLIGAQCVDAVVVVASTLRVCAKSQSKHAPGIQSCVYIHI